MKKNTTQLLHCGACMTNFEDIEALNKHLDTCIAAKTLLPFILKLWFLGEAKSGHHLSHFIQSIHNNIHLIERYSMAIVNEMSSFERAKIHSNLCDSLDLKYNDFRPFESENITKIPTVKEAENILWNALNEEILKLSTGIK